MVTKDGWNFRVHVYEATQYAGFGCEGMRAGLDGYSAGRATTNNIPYLVSRARG